MRQSLLPSQVLREQLVKMVLLYDGNAYNDAVSSIATAGKLTIAQTNAVAGAIATALNSGNTTQSQNLVTQAVFSVIPSQDKTTITGLNTVASTIQGIQSMIASLPHERTVRNNKWKHSRVLYCQN